MQGREVGKKIKLVAAHQHAGEGYCLAVPLL